MANSIPRKILKVVLWIVGIIVGLLLLVFVLLQVPAVQQRIAREVVKIGRETLDTDLGIGSIDIDFPSRIQLDDVYLNNPAGDSIARVGHLGVGINMLGLLSSKLEITDVVLRDVYANAVTTDSSSNIQFLLDFGKTTDSTATDTEVAVREGEVIDTTAGSGGFEIVAAGTTVLLERADIYYQDDPAGLLADVDARRLGLELNDIDLAGQVYDINYLELEGTAARVNLGPSSTPADTTESAPAAALRLLAGRLTIEETTFDYGMPGTEIATALPYVNLEGAELDLGETIAFRGELFQVRQLDVRMDTDAPELRGPGIDYGHLSLTEVEAELTDLAYITDSLHLRVRQLSGKEKSGLTLEKTAGTVIYNPSFLGLEDFVLRTANSELRSPNTALRYDFAGGADLNDMVARLRLNGSLSLRDVALLAPDLLTVPVVGDNLGQNVTFDVRADGTMARLNLSQVNIDGPGVAVRAFGRVENALDADNIAGQLTLREFRVVPGPLLPLVPEGMLPPDIDWPQKIVAEGTAEYRDDRLVMDLYAIENRTFGNGLQSRVRTSGAVAGLTTFPNTTLDVDLDTLLATRATILAYLPPGSLPEDYKIPDFVRASGSVVGPMDDLDVNLRMNLPGENTYARLNGNVRNALDPDNLQLDLAVSDLAINIVDIESILPDSTLPANLNLPNLRMRNARISGSLDNLTFDVPLETDNGIWQIDGKYNPRDLNVSLDIEGVRVPELFVGDLRDTLETLELGPLNLTAEIKGQLEPSMNLLVDATVGNDAVGPYLVLDASVQDNDYAAEFIATHPEFQAIGEGAYAIGADSTARVEAVVDIEKVGLEYWEITQVPLDFSGRLEARSEGLDPYDLEAFARLDSVALRGRTGSSYVDSLVLTASMHDNDNEVYVRSDVLDAELLGRFDPLKTPQKMVDFLMAYYDEDVRQPVPVEDGEKMDFVLELKRPQPLTGGLVPGLEELSPFNMSLLYRDAAPEFLFNLDLREIVYTGLEAHDLKLRAIGDTELLNWEADWSDINYNNQFELGRTQLTGETVDNELLVELKLFTKQDSLRHYLGFFVDPELDSLTVRLEEEQILNFETWTVPATNLITMAGPSLVIRDLLLRHEQQTLRAETTEPGDVVITFGDFQLQTPSRLIFSEEEVAAGTVNGTVGLDNVLTNLGIRSDLTVDQLKWEGTLLGDIEAKVTSDDEQNYAVDVRLENAGNNATVTGTVALNGPLDLVADVQRLQLKAAEPFSLGFLTQSEGYLTGRIDVGGTATDPDMDGQLRFVDASLVISLLGERFRIEEEAIRFNNSTIDFGNDFNIYDSQGGAATVSGEVRIVDLGNIELDMLVTAEDFVAINSTEKDNDMYYGKMSVDARVEIGGTANLPVLDVTATTNDNSEITYVYTLPGEGLVDAEGVMEVYEEYQWRDVIRRDTLTIDTTYAQTAGVRMTLDLDVDPNLEVTVVVDPVSGQTFVGRADGNLTIDMFPDGRMEATGLVELTEGKYDFVYQKIINKKFEVLPGSSVQFTGDLNNPKMDLKIRHRISTTPQPLVQGVFGEGTDVAGLRRSQTFFVDVTLEGDLLGSRIVTNVVYPENAAGNLGISEVSDALSTLRQDESRMTATAFQLLAFGSFNVPLLDQGGGSGVSPINTTLDQLMGNYLNSFADNLIGFVELDFGFDSYQNESTGQTETNLRLSLRKTLFDDRVIISVDGVAGTSEDELAGTNQTYLDNITAEYLINEDGSFRLKFFNDRDRDILVGGNVIRFGGRLTFAKDFERIRWFGGNDKGTKQ